MGMSNRLIMWVVMLCLAIIAVASGRVLADVPVIYGDVSSFQPNSGCCSTVVTIQGENFGDTHEEYLGRDVLAKSPIQTWADAEVLAIAEWNDGRIEAEIPCDTWDPALGPIELSVRVFNEDGHSNRRIFILLDCTSPSSIQIVDPDRGICKATIKLQNPNGQFGAQRTQVLDTETRISVTRVVEFVSSAGTYTALDYPAWSNTEAQVKFKDFYEDDQPRDNVQVDEPTIEMCDGMSLGPYNVYLRYIFFYDTNSNVQLDEGEDIEQIENSGPKVFELTNAPIVYSLYPTQILSGELLRIFGTNFGVVQGDGEVRVGGTTVASDPDLGLGYDLQTVGGGFREVNWEATRIRLFMPTNTIYYDNKIVCIWVEKDGAKSNFKKIRLAAPSP